MQKHSKLAMCRFQRHGHGINRMRAGTARMRKNLMRLGRMKLYARQ